MPDRPTTGNVPERGRPPFGPRRSAPPPGPAQRLLDAQAPYNFVPLTAGFATSPPPPADRYHQDRHTGRLDLLITAETPLYVRGTAGMDQLNTESKQLPGFFSPSGRPAIPGSSLRGMLRALVEIVAGTEPRSVDDSHYAFRAVAEHVASSLTAEYRQRLGTVTAGYLQRAGSGLRLLPARKHDGRQFWRVQRRDARQALGLPREEWLRSPVMFRIPPAQPSGGPADRVPLVTDLRAPGGAAPQGWASGWLIFSGDIQGKKHGWIVAAPDQAGPAIPVADDDERIYRAGWSPKLEEVNSSRELDFPLLPDATALIPCFYAPWADEARVEHLTFGHTRWFRLPYQHGVRSRIPDHADRPMRSWNLAEALFGRVGRPEETWAGRVFVEDALLDGDPTAALLDQALPRVLSSPKPTTFQHYLRQDRALQTRNRSDLQHWDSPHAAIRGYKFYWHRPDADWHETDAKRPQNGDSQGTPIQPVGAGSRFRGRLRFENLTNQELGALLFFLQLPPDCRHHIGMGKPLGLGSIRIEATLHLDDRHARYRSLFGPPTEEGALSWAEPALTAAPSVEQLRAAFASWALGAEGERTNAPVAADEAAAALWDGRLRPLKALLTWTTPPPLDQTAYMSLAAFRGRPVLPDALSVIGWLPAAAPRVQPADTGSPPAPALPTTSAGTRGPAVSPAPAPAPPASPAPRQQSAQPAVPPPPPEQPGRPPTLDDLARRFNRQAARPAQRPDDTRESKRARQEQQRIMQQQRKQPPDQPDTRPK